MNRRTARACPCDPRRLKVHRLSEILPLASKTCSTPSYCCDFASVRRCASATIVRASSAAYAIPPPAYRQATKSAKNRKSDLRVFLMSRCWLLIFQRLHQRSVHGGLGGPDGGDKCRGENRRHERQHDVRRERIRETQAADVVMHDLADVVQADQM